MVSKFLQFECPQCGKGVSVELDGAHVLELLESGESVVAKCPTCGFSDKLNSGMLMRAINDINASFGEMPEWMKREMDD